MLQGAGGLVLLERLLNLLLEHWGQRWVPSISQQVIGLLKVGAPNSHLQTTFAALKRSATLYSTEQHPLLRYRGGSFCKSAAGRMSEPYIVPCVLQQKGL